MKQALRRILKNAIDLYKKDIDNEKLSRTRCNLAKGIAHCERSSINAMEVYACCFVHENEFWLTPSRRRLADRLGALTKIKDTGSKYVWQQYFSCQMLRGVTQAEAQEFFQVLSEKLRRIK